MNPIVYTLRIGHILEHDIADLQGSFAETELEQLNCPDLLVSNPLTDRLPRAYLFNSIVVFDRQQALSQQNLQFLDDYFSRIVDADEGTDDIASFARAEFCELSIDNQLDCCIDLRGAASKGSGSQDGSEKLSTASS